jgi:hypothetical protein
LGGAPGGSGLGDRYAWGGRQNKGGTCEQRHRT